MQTIFGTPYTPTTPDELGALMRQAHRERAQAIRDALSSLFGWRHETKAAAGDLRVAAAKLVDRSTDWRRTL